MRFVNYNGKFFVEGSAVLPTDSRAFRYGDGVFETIKLKNGNFILLQEHLLRLWKGIDLLQFEKPKLFTKQLIRDELESLANKNKDSHARVRLTVFRGRGGLYDPENLHPNYIIESTPLPATAGQLNTNGLEVCLYKEAIKPCDTFSNLKHNNYLPYLMGALFAKKNKCNDALIFNQHMRLCDSSIANVFLVKNGEIITPALTEGCVAGVMRAFLLKQLPASGYNCRETEITEEMLLSADEVFLTNSVNNMKWVGAIGNKRYINQVCRHIFDKLSATNAEIIC